MPSSLDELWNTQRIPTASPAATASSSDGSVMPASSSDARDTAAVDAFQPCYIAPYSTNLSCRRLTHPPLHVAQNLVGEWATVRGASLCARSDPADASDMASSSSVAAGSGMQGHKGAPSTSTRSLPPSVLWSRYLDRTPAQRRGCSYFEEPLHLPAANAFPGILRRFDDSEGTCTLTWEGGAEF
jgi:hypothetical protein